MESLSFYCLDRPLYIENVALGAMFSLSMLEHVQSTHEHSMYFMISMVQTQRDSIHRRSVKVLRDSVQKDALNCCKIKTIFYIF
jgi:hypothetical protein